MDYIVALFGLVMINILLSGDNALVIALVSRNLPPDKQKQAAVWGSIGAIGLRVLLILIAIQLLEIHYLQVAGGLLLLWIAVKLIADDRGERDVKNIVSQNDLAGAVKTIILADLVMSLDNVIAIAGVAKGNISLLVLGLAISIPVIIWGSKAVGLLMQRWPVIIVAGAAFLGWTAGEMAVADQAIAPLLGYYRWLHWGIPALFGIIVVVAGEFLSQKQGKEKMR
jgi:YjbE family integral membrane protein